MNHRIPVYNIIYHKNQHHTEKRGRNSFKVRIQQQTTNEFNRNDNQLKENNNDEKEKFEINRYQHVPA
ncbi:7409_t:CDS:2, partial [Racocetra fulgida]